MKQIKKVKKTHEHNTSVEKDTKNHTSENKPVERFFDYLDTISFRQKPMSIEGIERLAVELVKWATHDEKAIKIAMFYTQRGIARGDYTNWMERVPALKIAHETAKEIIGNRRELGGLTKKFDAGMVAFSMPQYDEEWRQNIEWRSQMKAKESSSNGNTAAVINVIAEPVPDCPEVPRRVKKEEKRMTPEDWEKKLSKHPEMKYRKTQYD